MGPDPKSRSHFCAGGASTATSTLATPAIRALKAMYKSVYGDEKYKEHLPEMVKNHRRGGGALPGDSLPDGLYIIKVRAPPLRAPQPLSFAHPPAAGPKLRGLSFAHPPAAGPKLRGLSFAQPPAAGPKLRGLSFAHPPAAGPKLRGLSFAHPPAAGPKLRGLSFAQPPAAGPKLRGLSFAHPPAAGPKLRGLSTLK
jgi:hypothetical protein